MPIILEKLTFVCSSGSSCRTPYDGILRDNDGYHLTFCHGGDSGLSLQINDNRISVKPEEIRKVILKELGIHIDTNEKIFISPCHPKKVKEIYGDRLELNNILFDIPEWEGNTTFDFYDTVEVPANRSTKINTTYPIVLLFEESNKIDEQGYNNYQDYSRKIFNSMFTTP